MSEVTHFFPPELTQFVSRVDPNSAPIAAALHHSDPLANGVVSLLDNNLRADGADDLLVTPMVEDLHTYLTTTLWGSTPFHTDVHLRELHGGSYEVARVLDDRGGTSGWEILA
jgi:hypothetical protein